MKTQTIEVEGLPEGYRGVSINIPTYGQSYWNGHNVCVAGTSTPGYAYLIIEKIQPLRIVLEETSDYNKAYYSGLYETQVFSNGLRLRNQKHVWREVKETDIPLTKEEHKLSLTKKDILELIEHIKLGGQLNPKIAEFIKVNS